MKKRLVRRKRALAFILAAALVCSSQAGAAVTAAEDIIVEEVEVSGPEDFTAEQDASVQWEDVEIADDTGLISEIITVENTADAISDSEIIMDDSPGISIVSAEILSDDSVDTLGTDSSEDTEEVSDTVSLEDLEDVTDTGSTEESEDVPDSAEEASGTDGEDETEEVPDTDGTDETEEVPDTDDAEEVPNTDGTDDAEEVPDTDGTDDADEESETDSMNIIVEAADGDNMNSTSDALEAGGQDNVSSDETEGEAGGSLILEIETADDPEYAAEETEGSTEASEAYAEETVMAFLEPTGDASCAAYSRMRAFSFNTYENSYGEQLSGESAGIYQTMVDEWAAGKTDNLKYTFGSYYSFTTDGTVVNGAAQWDKNSCEEYQDVLTEIGANVQSAYDAFAYDYPEAFWLGKVAYSFGIGFLKSSETQLNGRITSITIYGTGSTTDENGTVILREKYEGAAGEVAAFQSAVDAAVAQISGSLPADADTYDTVKAIHDYVCNTVSYGENEYAHTAAGVFHKEPKVVVCEGYAKAVKILCRRFGISSALIVGSALKSTGASEDHMWNYVKMDDGNWYMVDATWDDQSGGIRYVYFLAGNSSQGFNAVISAERQLYTCFSNALYTMSFTLPVLSEEMYHHHTPGDWVIVNEATCTETGSRERYCTECGDLIKTESIERLAHTWDEGVVTKEAACTTAGEKTHTCSVCGATEIEIIAATGHSWDEGVVTEEATCTTTGVITYTCSACNETKTEPKPALGHDYSAAWTVDKAATCTAAGSKSRHCTRCSSTTDTMEIAASGHAWDAGKVTTAATCTAAGVKTYTCTNANCGATKTEVTPATGHVWDAGKVTVAATCTATGVRTYTCTNANCGATKTETIAATGHSMTHHAAAAATCTTAGNVEYWSCSKCKKNFSNEAGTKEISNVTIAATGHTWNSGTVTKAATCSASGTKKYTCTKCGATKTATIKALGKSSSTGHTWGAGKVTKAATCTATGTKKYTCTDCGATKTATIAKLGHKYGSYVTTRAATVLKTGVKTSTCSRCGATKTKTIAKLAKTIKLNVSSLPLKVGQSTTAVKVTKMSTGDYIKSWKSSNAKVAAVTKAGKITGKKAGTATITVTLASGAKASVKVTVKKTAVRTTKLSVAAKGAVLKSNKITLKKGAKMSLIASITPLTSSDKVLYASSDTKVATVSAKGVVLAKKAGTVRITVKAGTKKIVITVKVSKASTTAISGISANLTIKKGKTATLKPVLTPSNSDDKISYSSSKKSVASVSTGGKITAKKKGTAVITVKSGKIKVTCKVTVK